MIFEFKQTGQATLMESLATFFGSKAQKGQIILPEKWGTGKIHGLMLGGSLKLMLHRYVLKEDFTIKRMAIEDSAYNITFTFHAALPASRSDLSVGARQPIRFPSAQITSANIDYETHFEAGTAVGSIIIALSMDELKTMFATYDKQDKLQIILSQSKAYFFEEIISPQMQKIATELLSGTLPTDFNHYYYKLKAQELIFLFITELFKRPQLRTYPLHAADLRTVYIIRDAIIADLATPPNLAQLAAMAHMSESKLKRIFKQIFGNSIYNYYQVLRIKQAATLIREKSYTVSEAGYAVGYSNMSYFARLFEQQMGMKPKKYSAMRW